MLPMYLTLKQDTQKNFIYIRKRTHTLYTRRHYSNKPITCISEKLQINKTTTLQAIAIRPEGNSEIYKEQFHFNKATNKPIILKFPADEKYNGQGYGTLVDGISGNTTYGSDKWLGFSNGNDMIATIDLEKETPITSVSLNTCIATGDGIFDAQHICIELSSDGKNYKKQHHKSIRCQQSIEKKSSNIH